jgi:hypothetical protein
LSTVGSFAWISSITISKPSSKESPDMLIIGCPPWPLFLSFWVHPMNFGSVPASPTAPGRFTGDVSLSGLLSWPLVLAFCVPRGLAGPFIQQQVPWLF